MEQNKREQFIIRRIGGTTYKVRVVFNESGGAAETRYSRTFCAVGVERTSSGTSPASGDVVTV